MKVFLSFLEVITLFFVLRILVDIVVRIAISGYVDIIDLFILGPGVPVSLDQTFDLGFVHPNHGTSVFNPFGVLGVMSVKFLEAPNQLENLAVVFFRHG